MKRDKSGWDGKEAQGVKKNKIIHCVRLIVFSKSQKWRTDGKKGERSETVFKGSQETAAQKAFLLDTRQPTEPGAECPHASVGNDSESFTFLHAPHTKKRSLVSVNEMTKSTTKTSGSKGSSCLTDPGASMADNIKRIKESLLANNENGRGLLSFLFSMCSLLNPIFPLSSFPSAGRCNLLPFTPCQTRSTFWVTALQRRGKKRRQHEKRMESLCAAPSGCHRDSPGEGPWCPALVLPPLIKTWFAQWIRPGLFRKQRDDRMMGVSIVTGTWKWSVGRPWWNVSCLH